MTRQLTRYFSRTHVSIASFIIAFLAKTGLMRVLLDIGPDKFGQVIMARNLLQHHGLSIDQSAVCNLTEKFYAPAIGWPPGYSLLIGPFLWLCKDNILLACYILDCITALVFFWYLRKILLLIQFPDWSVNLFLIVQGFMIRDYILKSTPTDFMGMAAVLAVLYYAIKIATAPRLSLSVLSWFGFFIILASLIRHQNLGVGILLLVLMMIVGMIQKKKILYQSAIITLLSCLVIFLITAFVFRKMFLNFQSCNGLAYSGGGLIYNQHTGSFNMYAAGKGFYPSNLLSIYPFILYSFAHLEFYSVQLSTLWGSYTAWLRGATWLNYLGLLALIIIYVRFEVKKKFVLNDTPGAFLLLGGFISLAVLAVLALLSLLNDKDNGPPLFSWTFVMEPRYYAFPCLFLQIIAWKYLFLKSPDSVFRRILKWVLIIAIVVDVSHGVYFLSKRLSRPVPSFEQIISSDPEKSFVREFISQQRNSGSHIPIVVTSFDKLPGFTADWFGATAMFTPQELNKVDPRTLEPVLLLTMIRKQETPFLQIFLQNPDVKLIKQQGDYYFYLYSTGMIRKGE